MISVPPDRAGLLTCLHVFVDVVVAVVVRHLRPRPRLIFTLPLLSSLP